MLLLARKLMPSCGDLIALVRMDLASLPRRPLRARGIRRGAIPRRKFRLSPRLLGARGRRFLTSPSEVKVTASIWRLDHVEKFPSASPMTMRRNIRPHKPRIEKSVDGVA
jgi:hypothetical protein